jgi:hypothetical protein
MSTETCSGVAKFVRALAVLALPSGEQLAWLRSLGLGEPGECDELALEYDDGFLRLQSFVSNGSIPESAVSALAELDSLLNDMSGEVNSHLWKVEALEAASEWGEVRRVARAAIREL